MKGMGAILTMYGQASNSIEEEYSKKKAEFLKCKAEYEKAKASHDANKKHTYRKLAEKAKLSLDKSRNKMSQLLKGVLDTSSNAYGSLLGDKSASKQVKKSPPPPPPAPVRVPSSSYKSSNNDTSSQSSNSSSDSSSN
jgi:hypothetical protein